MKIHVYDTHVRTTKGAYLHFDVLVNDDNVPNVEQYVNQYLSNKGIEAENLRSGSCNFCHSEVANSDVQSQIKDKGHFVIPLQGC